ncbi:hypothetical protein HDU76_001568 [Blyttiomyces sp. JEL0837]|nr:hypothetical protein HDU76_001568 [Blyttiomyces sp. JEL0837]
MWGGHDIEDPDEEENKDIDSSTGYDGDNIANVVTRVHHHQSRMVNPGINTNTIRQKTTSSSSQQKFVVELGGSFNSGDDAADDEMDEDDDDGKKETLATEAGSGFGGMTVDETLFQDDVMENDDDNDGDGMDSNNASVNVLYILSLEELVGMDDLISVKGVIIEGVIMDDGGWKKLESFNGLKAIEMRGWQQVEMDKRGLKETPPPRITITPEFATLQVLDLTLSPPLHGQLFKRGILDISSPTLRACYLRGEIQKVVIDAPNLKVLKVWSMSMHFHLSLSNIPLLEHLETPLPIVYQASKSPCKLSTLLVSHHYNGKGADDVKVLQSLILSTRPSRLKIQDAPWSTMDLDHAFYWLFLKNPDCAERLKGLHIYDSPTFTAASLLKVAETIRFPALSVLDLRRCPNLDMESLSHIPNARISSEDEEDAVSPLSFPKIQNMLISSAKLKTRVDLSKFHVGAGPVKDIKGFWDVDDEIGVVRSVGEEEGECLNDRDASKRKFRWRAVQSVGVMLGDRNGMMIGVNGGEELVYFVVEMVEDGNDRAGAGV